MLLNHLPVLVFALAILVVTGFVIGFLEIRTQALMVEAEQGVLKASDLESMGHWLQGAWLGSLGVFFVAAVVGVWVALRANLGLTRRLDAITRYAKELAAESPSEPLEPLSEDALGEVESCLSRLGEAVRSREAARAAESRLRLFEAQLQRALSYASDEPSALAAVGRALESESREGVASELLLADSSQAHMRLAVTDVEEGSPRCRVSSPEQCPAVRHGVSMVCEDSARLDACPMLIGRRCSSLCVPVSIAGRTVGVLRSEGRVGEVPEADRVRIFEVVARETSGRLSMLRALSSSEIAASTDPLTGLLNRRSFEAQASARARLHPRYVVVMADIDHFKKLNDTNGHAVGDKVIRAFANALEAGAGEEALVGRHGGEEFVAMFGGVSPREVVEAMERVRGLMARSLTEGHIPAYTASFGVAEAISADAIDDAIQRADGALYEAKEAGRDRVVLCGKGVVAGPSSPNLQEPLILSASPRVA